MQIKVMKDILSANNLLAEENKILLNEEKVFTIDMVSSPGSGKTSILERTLEILDRELKIAVIEGDIQTQNDAERISRFNVPVVQINTGGACHLNAGVIKKVLPEFNLSEIQLLIIENVGNLVCPSSYNLGEDLKVTVLSVTEGDDKPQKYPAIFRASKVLIINKIDLLDYTDFSLNKVKENALNINPDLIIFETSCRTKQGLDKWVNWLKSMIRKNKGKNSGKSKS